MRFRHTEDNVEAAFDDYQNTPKCSSNMFLSNLDELDM